MTRYLSAPILGVLLTLGAGIAGADAPASMPEKMMDAVKGMVAHGMKPIMEMPAHMQSTSDKEFKYKPSYMTVTGDRTVTEADFEDPAMCAGCHPKQYQGWQGSMHSNAFVDPIFQKLWS
ncbi:MAG: hypothetical protein KDI42_08345, partial [Gammaproteobacteria bacterium]|nr:hypothetical protein [Gammaproteobacteria bacterium]